MNNFTLTDKGAVIEITNNSTEQIITNNEGFISPTLIPNENTISSEIKPAFTIQIPSFVSYKINKIAPGDSISFVVTKPDEVFYYLGIANSKIEGISVSVTPITDDTNLQDKTIVPTTEEQVVTADEGYDGLGTVTVEAVTASIDENITAENIKKDVEILGVTGSYEGSGGGNATGVVKFYDAKGNVVNQYNSADFLQLNAMPANSTQNGLTCQGWNWSLADAKAYVGQFGNLNIGQMYTSTNEAVTKIYVNITAGTLSPTLALCPNGELIIDWGDNTATDTMTGSDDTVLVYQNHTYASSGSYVISITPTQGSTFGFGSNNSETTLLCKDSSATINENTSYFMTISDIYIGNNVTTIDENTFMNFHRNLTVVILLTDNVKQSSFGSMYSMNIIGIIPNSIVNISNYDLEESGILTALIIPPTIVTIGESAFTNIKNIQSIIIPNTVISIEDYAFSTSYSGICNVSLPNSILSIGDNVFYDCYYIGQMFIPNSVTSLGSEFCGSSEYAELDLISFGNSITTINYSSGYSNLSSVLLGNSITSIGDGAFEHCSSLTSITIPNSVTSIGANAFSSCSSLTSITIPNSVTSIGDNTFENCGSFTSIIIPGSVTSIGNNAFSNCSKLTSVVILDGVTSIGYKAFSNCSNLISIKLPNTLTSIGDNVFENCNLLTSLTIPGSITNLNTYFLSDMQNITSLVLMEGISSIGPNVLNNPPLTSIVFPSSLTHVDYYNILYLYTLSQIEFLSTTPPVLQGNSFENLPTNCIIYVPNGTLSAYTSASNYPDPSVYTYIERQI